MNDATLFRITAWSARASAALTIIAFVSLMLLLQGGNRFKRLDDIAVLLLTMTRLVLPPATMRLVGEGVRGWAVAAVGSGTLLVVGLIQLLVLAERTQFEAVARVLGTAQGFWGAWLASSMLLVRSDRLPQPVRWIGAAAGIGYVLPISGLWWGEENPVAIVGTLSTLLTYPTWALMMAAALAKASKAAVPALVATSK